MCTHNPHSCAFPLNTPNAPQAELDQERDRLQVLERKLTHDQQILNRERQHFDFRSQQEVMIQQLVQDKKDLTVNVKQLSDALVAANGE